MMIIGAALFFLLLAGFGLPASAQPPWQALKEKVIQADLSQSRKQERALARQALQMAEACLAKQPQAIGCRYYRAQSLGLSSRSFFGYVGRVRSMLADWEAVLREDSRFDFGGPHRMIAEIYLELPKHFGPKDLRQDLNKALHHLIEAIAISNYPANWLDLAKVYEAMGKEDLAQAARQKAKLYLPQWPEDPYSLRWHLQLEPGSN